jgi:hypothetical protein
LRKQRQRRRQRESYADHTGSDQDLCQKVFQEFTLDVMGGRFLRAALRDRYEF